MKELEEHMVLNPELKKSFDANVRKSKAKAKLDVRTFGYFFLQNNTVALALALIREQCAFFLVVVILWKDYRIGSLSIFCTRKG